MEAGIRGFPASGRFLIQDCTNALDVFGTGHSGLDSLHSYLIGTTNVWRCWNAVAIMGRGGCLGSRAR
jgi:hypothetical protein